MTTTVDANSRAQSLVWLATAAATRRERQFALAIAVASLLLFLAFVPFVRVPLIKMPAFIPSYQAALFFIDIVTAALLLDQSIRLRSIALLVLASGYLFDALIIVPHSLTFPGAFSPTGLLGAGEQTTAWLYVFWHGGFPLFVIAYVLLRRREEQTPTAMAPRMGRAALMCVAGVVGLTLALTLLATRGHDLLPVVMQGSDYLLLTRKGISPAVWALTLVAIVALWQRRDRAMDLWLMVVMWVWLFDIALAAVIGSSRFDLGFYAGRLFGLVAASFLLIMLVFEMARVHSGALAAVESAELTLARLARQRVPSPGLPGAGSTETFIQRQNIEHYRALLESGSLDETQRRSIEQLLAEELKRTGPT